MPRLRPKSIPHNIISAPPGTLMCVVFNGTEEEARVEFANAIRDLDADVAVTGPNEITVSWIRKGYGE